jgi:hypothetical protein
MGGSAWGTGMGNAETRSVTKPSRATCLTFGSQTRVVLRGSVNDELNDFRLRFFRLDPVGQLKFSYRFDLRFFRPFVADLPIKKSSSFFPSFIAATSQRGFAPRPAQTTHESSAILYKTGFSILRARTTMGRQEGAWERFVIFMDAKPA